jgi:guanylate kinase
MPDALGVFILPPSLAVLESRLRARQTDSDAVIARRLAAARAEIAHCNDYDYVIINSDLEVAIGDLVAVVRAARLRRTRQSVRHATLLRQFD